MVWHVFALGGGTGPCSAQGGFEQVIFFRCASVFLSIKSGNSSFCTNLGKAVGLVLFQRIEITQKGSPSKAGGGGAETPAGVAPVLVSGA